MRKSAIASSLAQPSPLVPLSKRERRLSRRAMCHSTKALGQIVLFAVAVAAWLALAISAIAANPADQAFDQAKRALETGEYDAAIAQLDEAIRLGPKEAKFRGMRGMAWLRKGEYAKGSADLKAAIGLNPSDAGVDYRPSHSQTTLGRGPAARAAAGRRDAARPAGDGRVWLGERISSSVGGAQVRRRGSRHAHRLGPFAAAALRRRTPGAGRRR